MLRWLRRRPRAPVRDYGMVAPWLLVGPALDAAGYRSLRDGGVTHVLDLRSEDSDDADVMRDLGIQWARIPIQDRTAPTDAQLDEINSWLDAANEQPVVYVHCEGGLGRSPTIAMALLMQRGFSRAEAHRFILAARSVVAATPDQETWLDRLERTVSVISDDDSTPGR